MDGKETDRRINELYTEYKAWKDGKLHPKQPDKFLSTVKKILHFALGLSGEYGINEEIIREGLAQKARNNLTDCIRFRLGKYPLARMGYISSLGQSGFSFGFDHQLGEDIFNVDFFSYNNWGILVQKESKDYSPTIEILERTLELGKDEDPNLDPLTETETARLLHLPEGFRIPAGPLRFEDDRLPISEEELAADKAQAIEMAEAAGIRVNRDVLKIADSIPGSTRKYPDRYFYWQPVLPDTPRYIGIDFDSIEPYHMGLSLENAPVFNNTLTMTDAERRGLFDD